MARHFAHRQRRTDRRTAYAFYEQREWLRRRGDIHIQRLNRQLSPEQLAEMDMRNAQIARGDPRVVAGLRHNIKVLKRGGRPERMGGGWADGD